MSLETMTKLQTVTVGVGGTTTVTFSNIPQGYTDLKVLMSARTAGSNGGRDYAVFRINGDTTTAFNRKWMYGFDNNVSGSGSNTTETFGSTITLPDSAVTNLFSNNQITFYNYSSNNYKTIVSETNATKTASATFILGFSSTTWQNSAPITSLSFTAVLNGDSASLTGTFVENSTFTLYGIKNAAKTAGNSIKATGGNIVFDGTYVYHVFPSTGAFVATQPLTVDYLVVAGGGGGSFYNGGGGGAGGLRSTLDTTGGGGTVESKLSLAPTSYAITVGAGGAAGLYSGLTSAGSGSDSSFSTITSTGGGRAGSTYATPTGASGGSGGGGGNSGGNSASGGTGTTNQGYAGGAKSGSNDAGAGGGGAGGVGQVRTSKYDGAGGPGVYLPSFFLTTGAGVNGYFAGGGGGGFANASGSSAAGGAGGGGVGGYGAGGGAGQVAAGNGVVGTGGGGGGAGIGSSNGGAGGSGVVIIRYKG